MPPSEHQTISEIGERLLVELISKIGQPAGDFLRLGIGDDAAIGRLPDGHDVVVSCDSVPEDLFAWEAGLITPCELGEYAARVNISDLAAMGATPHALFWLLRSPANTPVTTIAELARGIAHVCASHSTSLAGGDSKTGSVLSVAMTAIGSVPRDAALMRSGARPGDVVFCCGELGLASAALAYFRLRVERDLALPADAEEQLRRALWAPSPRVDDGLRLQASARCTSCIDNTDGLGRTLLEISRSSNVGMRIDAGALPLHPLTVDVAHLLGIEPVSLTMAYGLDLALLGTATDNSPELAGVAMPIGVVTDEDSVLVSGQGPVGAVAINAGTLMFEHFRRPFRDTIAEIATDI